MYKERNIKEIISSDTCSHCGGEVDGWKCPKCGRVSESFDPTHWRLCKNGGKMQLRCRECGEAESNCECSLKKKSTT